MSFDHLFTVPTSLPGVGFGSPGTATGGERAISIEDGLWAVAAAHVLELSRLGVMDDAAFGAIADVLTRVALEAVQPDESPRMALTEIKARWNAGLPAGLEGAISLGLSNEEWLATAARLRWRGVLSKVVDRVDGVRDAAMTLAQTHIVTIMPLYIGGRPGQPTTLAHYLGPLIDPLASGRTSLSRAIDMVNRSPLGAGIGIGDVVGVERDALATSLGFGSGIANTLDAVSNVEDVIAALDAIGAVLRPMHRFAVEIAAGIRMDATSFVLDEDWIDQPESSMPTLKQSSRLTRLILDLDEFLEEIDSSKASLATAPYEPLGANLDRVFATADRVEGRSRNVAGEIEALLRRGLVVNRAWLGNRAGRGYTTAGDLETFLMTEEELAPHDARAISVRVLAQLQETGLEVSGITQDMIDAAGLVVIGREIKVEMERLGRFLAPRRAIERRIVTGSPAPDQARTWLADAAASLTADREDMRARSDVWERAQNHLRAAIESAAADADSGEGRRGW